MKKGAKYSSEWLIGALGGNYMDFRIPK